MDPAGLALMVSVMLREAVPTPHLMEWHSPPQHCKTTQRLCAVDPGSMGPRVLDEMQNSPENSQV